MKASALLLKTEKNMKKKKAESHVPRIMKTAHGHECNAWCGSCQFKEIQSSNGGSSDGLRWCTKLNKEVEMDDICEEWKMDEHIAKL